MQLTAGAAAEPDAEATGGSEVLPAPVDGMGPVIAVPPLEELGSSETREVSMEDLFGEANAHALSALEAPVATGPSTLTEAPLGVPGADPGSCLGGDLGGNPALVVRVEA